MSEQNYIDFDLQVALKQPERVAQRGTSKPVEWKYFEGAKTIVYVNDKGNFVKVNLGGLNLGLSAYDLILLPEPKPFELIDGEWYWVKVVEMDKWTPMLCRGGEGFAGSLFDFSKSQVHAIHPEPIKKPK